MKEPERYVCWFSCGAASAVATKIALARYPNCVIVNEDTGSEHPDNERFKSECETWFGQEIITIKSDKYEDIWDVFKQTRYLVGPSGARCTGELKRKPAEKFLNHFKDAEIFGYTVEERRRLARFREQNPERHLICPLVDDALTKADCLGIIEKAGIEIPAMYRLGFTNNNCIGCVKASSMKYWRRIRRHFPEVFDRMAKQERELGIAIIRKTVGGERVKVFLDELPESSEDDEEEEEPEIQCGLFCMAASETMEND